MPVETWVPHWASVISSTRRTETPAKYIHLYQRLHDRGLAASVTLYNRRLEGLPVLLGDLQGEFAGLCMKLALLTAGSGIGPVWATLMALDSTQHIGPRHQTWHLGPIPRLPWPVPSDGLNLCYFATHNLVLYFTMVVHVGVSPMWS